MYDNAKQAVSETTLSLKSVVASTGEIFSLYFGSRLVVVLNSYDVLYQAFVKHGDTLSDRPPSAFIVNSANFNKGL